MNTSIPVFVALGPSWTVTFEEKEWNIPLLHLLQWSRSSPRTTGRKWHYSCIPVKLQQCQMLWTRHQWFFEKWAHSHLQLPRHLRDPEDFQGELSLLSVLNIPGKFPNILRKLKYNTLYKIATCYLVYYWFKKRIFHKISTWWEKRIMIFHFSSWKYIRIILVWSIFTNWNNIPQIRHNEEACSICYNWSFWAYFAKIRGSIQRVATTFNPQSHSISYHWTLRQPNHSFSFGLL